MGIVLTLVLLLAIPSFTQMVKNDVDHLAVSSHVTGFATEVTRKDAFARRAKRFLAASAITAVRSWRDEKEWLGIEQTRNTRNSVQI